MQTSFRSKLCLPGAVWTWKFPGYVIGALWDSPGEWALPFTEQAGPIRHSLSSPCISTLSFASMVGGCRRRSRGQPPLPSTDRETMCRCRPSSFGAAASARKSDHSGRFVSNTWAAVANMGLPICWAYLWCLQPAQPILVRLVLGDPSRHFPAHSGFRGLAALASMGLPLLGLAFVLAAKTILVRLGLADSSRHFPAGLGPMAGLRPRTWGRTLDPQVFDSEHDGALSAGVPIGQLPPNLKQNRAVVRRWPRVRQLVLSGRAGPCVVSVCFYRLI